MVEFSYGLAFMTGVLGSGHCLGMCGGLVSGFFMKLGAKTFAPYLAYHCSRRASLSASSVPERAAGCSRAPLCSSSFSAWQPSGRASLTTW